MWFFLVHRLFPCACHRPLVSRSGTVRFDRRLSVIDGQARKSLTSENAEQQAPPGGKLGPTRREQVDGKSAEPPKIEVSMRMTCHGLSAWDGVRPSITTGMLRVPSRHLHSADGSVVTPSTMTESIVGEVSCHLVANSSELFPCTRSRTTMYSF